MYQRQSARPPGLRNWLHDSLPHCAPCSCRGRCPRLRAALCHPRPIRASGWHFFGVRPSGGPLPAAFRPPGLPRCRSGAPGGLVALRPWVLRAGALRRPRAAFFRPPAPALFGVDFYETPVLYSLLQGGALLLSIEKCLGLWPGRFSFFSPPPPPPPSGGGAQEGTTRSAPLRSKNGTPGFLRARKLHKTGILFNFMDEAAARMIPTPSVSPISEN